MVAHLAADPRFAVTGTTHRAAGDLPSGIRCVGTRPLAADTEWGAALEGIDVVVHLAARVHVMRETASDPLATFRKLNVAGTLPSVAR